MNRTRTTPIRARREAAAPVQQAVVIGLDDGRVLLRVSGPGATSTTARARVAIAALYSPAEGDRVLVAGSHDDLFVIGVIHAAEPRVVTEPPALALSDGTTLRVHDDAAEIRDPEGRLLVRYANGSAEIAVPAGNLTLAAPDGRVVVRAGRDITLEAARDVEQRAGRNVTVTAGSEGASPQVRVGASATEVDTPRFELRTEAGRVEAGEVTVIAQRIATTAKIVVQQVERLEVTATRIVERSRDTFREATDLLQTRAGRARTLIQDVYALYSRRTTMDSKEDTSIDGKRVLLG